jgi:hypothetical protein
VAERYVWTDDLAALGETTRSQLRSIAATRANLRMEKNHMSLIKRRPLLAAAIAALVIGIAAPVAYAIGTRIFIIPDQPAEQIQTSVQDQLNAAGIPATAQVDKAGDKLRVRIESDDPSVGSNLPRIEVEGQPPVRAYQVRLEVKTKLTPDQLDRLQRVIAIPALEDPKTEDDPDAVEEAVTDALVAAGFKASDVQVSDNTLTVTITQPPTP